MRIKFKKLGNLQYISHLDLVRTMQKIIVRAGLPLWYTEGFNPKPKMIFAAPLSIGTESVCEFMDIRLVDDMPPDEVMKRLNRNMTDEMQVLDAYYTTEKLTELKWLAYSISIKTSGASEQLAARCEEVLRSPSVVIEKKGKPHEDVKTQDIAPLIKSVSVKYSEGMLGIDCLLCADASSFLNPEYVVKALKTSLGILSDPVITNEYYSIMRLCGYRGDMSDFSEHR